MNDPRPPEASGPTTPSPALDDIFVGHGFIRSAGAITFHDLQAFASTLAAIRAQAFAQGHAASRGFGTGAPVAVLIAFLAGILAGTVATFAFLWWLP